MAILSHTLQLVSRRTVAQYYALIGQLGSANDLDFVCINRCQRVRRTYTVEKHEEMQPLLHNILLKSEEARLFVR